MNAVNVPVTKFYAFVRYCDENPPYDENTCGAIYLKLF